MKKINKINPIVEIYCDLSDITMEFVLIKLYLESNEEVNREKLLNIISSIENNLFKIVEKTSNVIGRDI